MYYGGDWTAGHSVDYMYAKLKLFILVWGAFVSCFHDHTAPILVPHPVGPARVPPAPPAPGRAAAAPSARAAPPPGYCVS